MSNPDEQALYADDPRHPLHQLNTLDMIGKRRTGGVDLVILPDGPLRGDERTQRRLLRKLDAYLGYIASPDFAKEFGAPDPVTTHIVVRLDPQSDPRVVELLRQSEAWVRAGRATLVVEAPAGPVH